MVSSGHWFIEKNRTVYGRKKNFIQFVPQQVQKAEREQSNAMAGAVEEGWSAD
jgi:hypothetical protein